MPALGGCPINQSFLLVTNTDVNNEGVAVYPLGTTVNSMIEEMLKSFTENLPKSSIPVLPANISSVVYAPVNATGVIPTTMAVAEHSVATAEQHLDTITEQNPITPIIDNAKTDVIDAQTILQELKTGNTGTLTTKAVETFSNITSACGVWTGTAVCLLIVIIIILFCTLSK